MTARPGVDASAPRRRRAWARRFGLAALAFLAALVVLAVVAALDPDAAFRVFRKLSFAGAGARTGTVTVDGTTLAWAEIGQGRPVLFVHGLGGESAGLLPLARALAPKGYRVLLVDLPGAGNSPLAARPLGIDTGGTYALDAAAALGMGPRPAILGHSLGGWMVAWQALAHPERCGPVALVCPAGMTFEPPPLNELMPRNVPDGRRNMERLFVHPPHVPWPLMWLTVHRSRSSNLALLRSAVSGRYLLDGLLAGMTVPALVVAGEKDRIVPAASAREMAAGMPGAHYVEFGDASHMVIWEHPEEVAAAVDTFLRAHPAAEATAITRKE